MARVLGLDLGSHSLKAVELRPTLRGAEILQLRASPCPRDASLADALRDLMQSHALSGESVVCALPADRLSIRRMRFPFRERRRIAQAVPFEVEAQTPLELDEILIEWTSVGEDRAAAEVVAAIAPRAEVARMLERLGEAELEPRILEAEGLALANLAGLFELPGTRLLVDLGHRKTTLCLCVDGRPIAARTLPVGGRAVTEALAKETHLELAQAEQRKCEEGVFGTRATPLAAGVLERIAREITRSLGAFEPVLAAHAQRAVDEMTLLGGGAHLQRVEEFLCDRVGVPARRLEPPPGALGNALLAAGDPALYAPALALALRATPLARTQMNFRKDEFAKRFDFQELRRQLRLPGWLAAAALVFGLTAALTQIAVNTRRAGALERRVAQIYVAAALGERAPENAVGAMRNAVSEARARADLLGVSGGVLSPLGILAEISARVPESLELTIDNMRIEGRAARLRGFGRTVQTLNQLEAELSKVAEFSQVKVSDIQDDPRHGGYTFQLTISLDALEQSS